ncbi:MAG: HIT family protein [Deltaproteobacteria bacterium]
MSCVFCEIIAGRLPAAIVFEDEATIAFLDKSPVFVGHVLVTPKVHHETLTDVPAELLTPLFVRVQTIARAVEAGLEAQGTFVAMNNRISQSVPHLHVHVVPRRKKDGLRGFFWPRTKYTDEAQMHEVAARIGDALNP